MPCEVPPFGAECAGFIGKDKGEELSDGVLSRFLDRETGKETERNDL